MLSMTSKAVPANDIVWGAAPSGLPAGAEAALLVGDPSKSGVFVVPLRGHAGYRVAPHTHPTDEVVTVISGRIRMGMGKLADPQKEMTLSAGGLMAVPTGTFHWVTMEEDTILQVNSVGPWGITYGDPKDYPRNLITK
jgi:quercetin dioxygenase-like cupin family protein